MQSLKEMVVVNIDMRIAGKPLDPLQEINSSYFLKALRGGAPATERAFRYLVRHMQAPLARYLGRWLREPEAIQDVLQETLLAVHLGLPRFEGKCRLTTWVYSLAYHKAMNRLAEYYQPTGRNVAEDLGMHLEDAEPRPDEAAHKGLLIARLQVVAERIPKRYREVWRLRDLEGMSGEAAAKALAITPALVRVHLHRARGLIIARLHKEQPGLIRELVQ
jgi:RNA polymerase sigma-70 factor, ECF subfamily